MGVDKSNNDKSENSNISFFFQKLKQIQKIKLKGLNVVDSGKQECGTGRDGARDCCLSM